MASPWSTSWCTHRGSDHGHQVVFYHVHDPIGPYAQPPVRAADERLRRLGSSASAATAVLMARMPSWSAVNLAADATAISDHRTLTGQ